MNEQEVLFELKNTADVLDDLARSLPKLSTARDPGRSASYEDYRSALRRARRLSCRVSALLDLVDNPR